MQLNEWNTKRLKFILIWQFTQRYADDIIWNNSYKCFNKSVTFMLLNVPQTSTVCVLLYTQFPLFLKRQDKIIAINKLYLTRKMPFSFN